MQKSLGITIVGLSLVAIALVHASTPNPDPLQQIAGYKQWTRVSIQGAKINPINYSSLGG